MLGASWLIGTSPSLIFPVGVFWMFHVPKRTPALYLRNGREVVFRRRRRRGPLERPGIPWIASGVLTREYDQSRLATKAKMPAAWKMAPMVTITFQVSQPRPAS